MLLFHRPSRWERLLGVRLALLRFIFYTETRRQRWSIQIHRLVSRCTLIQVDFSWKLKHLRWSIRGLSQVAFKFLMHGTLGIVAFLWPRGPHLHRSGPAEIDVGGVESSWIMAQLSALWDEDESHWQNVTNWKPVTLAESQIWNPKLRDLTSVATLIDQTRYYRSSPWKTCQNLFQLNPGHGPMVGCSLGSSYWFITAPFHGKFSRS